MGENRLGKQEVNPKKKGILETTNRRRAKVIHQPTLRKSRPITLVVSRFTRMCPVEGGHFRGEAEASQTRLGGNVFSEAKICLESDSNPGAVLVGPVNPFRGGRRRGTLRG